MRPSPPKATIRTQVVLPLRFADGYATPARVFTFNNLVDGREHLALGLGTRARAMLLNHLGKPGFLTTYVAQVSGGTPDIAVAELIAMLEKAGIPKDRGLRAIAA